LPEVLDALSAQTRPPDRLVGVDTGSADDSLELVREALGPDAVQSVARDVTFGAAVQAGLDSLGAETATADDSDRVEWIWLLHDDCAPAPTVLDQLLVRVIQSPSVWMVGPKVRGWGGARLLEAGLTIDATGHIDTGIDGVELDQGQRDEVDEVLAVGTAGALIRRDMWVRLGGLDPAWSTYGDDVDLGWRVNLAGGRVVVASRAIVRHARAQTVGKREPAGQAGSPLVVRRRSGMQVVLTNTAGWLVPVLLARYLLGGLLRALGLLVVSRRPARAGAELIAVGEVFTHLGLIATGRRDRAGPRRLGHRELRHLLPKGVGRWRSSPFRIGRAHPDRSGRPTTSGSGETGPVAEESESLSLDDSVFARFFRRPATLLVVVMSLLALIADRHLFSTVLHGGRLLPAPNGASDLWSTYLAAWHPSMLGSATPAPPSLAILAALSTLALGKVWLVVDVLLLGAVPLAALSAYTAARGLTAAVRVRVWTAAVYSLLPSVTGAVAGGRLDVAVAAIGLPLVIRVCASAVRQDSRGWRRAAGAGLSLAIVTAFAPLVWVIAVPALLLGVAFMATEWERPLAVVRRLPAVVITLAVPVAVLVPWSGRLFAHPRLVLTGVGLPEFYASHNPPSGVALALLHAGGPAQPPLWVGIPVLLAALLGLSRRNRIAAARTGAVLLVGGVGVAIEITRSAGVVSGAPGTRHWPGVALLVAGAGALLAILVAATGARPRLRQQSFGWRQPAAAGLVLSVLAATAWLGAGWAVRGAGAPLSGTNPKVLPLFIQSELAFKPTSPRALMLVSAGPAISYTVVRRPGGPQLGDADTAPSGAESAAAAAHLDTAVRDLVAAKPGAVAELTPFDIGYIVVPAQSTARVRSALGRAGTLTVLPAPGVTVWRSRRPTGELTVLHGHAATEAAAGNVPTTPHLLALPAKPGSADVPISASAAGGLAVLAEPANPGWRATLDGKPLVRQTAYGWAQAFVLPPAGGRLRIEFRSSPRHRWLLVELGLTAVAVIAAMPGRRPDDDLDGLG
jgi:GT2 family glycosyltransferase